MVIEIVRPQTTPSHNFKVDYNNFRKSITHLDGYKRAVYCILAADSCTSVYSGTGVMAFGHYNPANDWIKFSSRTKTDRPSPIHNPVL